MKTVCITLLLFSVTLFKVGGRSMQYSSSSLISDGNENVEEFTQNSRLVIAAEEDCSILYGLFPCSYTVLGKLFMVVLYALLYIIGESYVVAGGELIFEVNGFVGANLFHVLSFIPDAVILLVSGITVSAESAQSKVSIGVGLLVGSTVFYLTAVWGLCVYAGKCDLEGKDGQDTKDTKKFSLLGSGVSTEIWTIYAARIMVISIIPFVVSQIPQVLNLSTRTRVLAVLISLAVSVTLTISYFFYEFYCEPLLQASRINSVEQKQVMSGLLIYLDSCAPGELLDSNGEPNKEVLKTLFGRLDQDNDGYVTPAEMRPLIIQIQSQETGLSTIDDHLVDNIMRGFDSSRDKQIDANEFVEHISEWLKQAKHPRNSFQETGRRSINYSFKHLQKGIQQEYYMLVSEKTKRENEIEHPRWTSFKAAMFLLLGICIAVLVADPLIDAVDEFSKASGISSFYVAFVVLPLATNSVEALSAIKMARQKTQKTISSTLSELSVTVTLNNLLCLSVFLAIVYTKGLQWDFGSEVLVLLIVCSVMGALSSFRPLLPLWTAVVAALLYPSSLILVYVLHSFSGWS